MWIADIHKWKDSAYALSSEKRAEALEASAAFLQKYAKSGQWRALYQFANGRGGIAIWEFESGQEMSRILQESPLFGYLDSEVVPLTSIESVSNFLKQNAS
jgi:muconolactone delta-isomerase